MNYADLISDAKSSSYFSACAFLLLLGFESCSLKPTNKLNKHMNMIKW